MGVVAMEEKGLEALTPKQRTAFMLRENGLTMKEIAAKMGLSYSMVREHLARADRRLREYEQYIAYEERNREPVDLPLTRGEVKLLMDALHALEREYEKEVIKNVKTDWRAKLPLESKIIADLNDRMQALIYGKVLTRMPPNWEKADE